MTDSRRKLSDIALDSGFYDQSTFSRYFRKYMELTPKAYRRQFLPSS